MKDEDIDKLVDGIMREYDKGTGVLDPVIDAHVQRELKRTREAYGTACFKDKPERLEAIRKGEVDGVRIHTGPIQTYAVTTPWDD